MIMSAGKKAFLDRVGMKKPGGKKSDKPMMDSMMMAKKKTMKKGKKAKK